MGEVYKAGDTRLGRTVAIKILPASLGADPEHRRRFEHEARAASSLDHPHICTLHDIGSDHGVAGTTWGVIVGTVAYMAPERIEGLEADARTDLFAFGCLLYEMLAGRRAFSGETEAATIRAVMTSHPPLISSLLRAAPRALDHLVQTCLAKDPDERMQNAQDVVIPSFCAASVLLAMFRTGTSSSRAPGHCVRSDST